MRKNPAKRDIYCFFVYTTHFWCLWDWSEVPSLFLSCSPATRIVDPSLVASLYEVSRVLPSSGSRNPGSLGNRSKLEMLLHFPFPSYNTHKFASFFFITRYVEPAMSLRWGRKKNVQALPSNRETSMFKSSGNLGSALLCQGAHPRYHKLMTASFWLVPSSTHDAWNMQSALVTLPWFASVLSSADG